MSKTDIIYFLVNNIFFLHQTVNTLVTKREFCGGSDISAGLISNKSFYMNAVHFALDTLRKGPYIVYTQSIKKKKKKIQNIEGQFVYLIFFSLFSSNKRISSLTTCNRVSKIHQRRDGRSVL